MAGALELKFLGDLEVIREGRPLPLPPSKKTRALLAYLALNDRAFRREHLCELLWEIPDDPRGSLRWSLSKLRHLVDDNGHPRVLADRLNVSLDTKDVVIDIGALGALVDGGLEACTPEQLEHAAARYGGSPLEGLDLPDFHDFDAWCSSVRESATQAQKKLLFALVRRTADDAQKALPHARSLVRLASYDEAARSFLIRLLVRLGQQDQAEQQYQIGVKLLKEAGIDSTGELRRARYGPPGGKATIAPAPVPKSVSTPKPFAASPSPAPAAAEPCTPASVSSQLIGREAEIACIASTLNEVVQQRRAALVLVTGEPGIGKSRLLEAAADEARKVGALFFEACSYESETIRPFALWLDALRRHGRETASAVFGKTDHTNRNRLFDGLSALVSDRAQTHPIVLMFDDIQWSDESSAAALHYVARSNRDQPVLGVLAARPDELRDNTPVLRAVRELRHAGLLEEIRLGPLAPEAVRELISTRCPQVDGDRLSRQCSGNPLLAIELARAEAAGDSGQSLGDLVQERLARFDSEGGDVLRWAAVLAPRIDATTLARVTGLDWNRIGEVLETAARQSMLLPVEGGFRFSHDLIARSIHASISPARRRTMHRRVAEMLEQDTALDAERAADLAHHAAQSADPGLAARAMALAGRLCLRFFANEEALTLAQRGLQWASQLASVQRVCLTLELHEIKLFAAPVENWEAAAREYAALAEQALDHGALAHARRGYYMSSYVRWMHGHWAGAQEQVLLAERVARGGSDEEHIVGMADAARCLALLERDLAHADALLMEAQALATRKHISHHAIPAALGMLRFHENKFDEAIALLKDARTLARSAGDRISEFQANEYLAMIDIERGRMGAAQAICTELIELGEKLREGSEGPFARALHGLCHYALTDDSASLDAALEDLRTADAKHRLAYTLTRAALLDVERQRPASAAARASEALSCAELLDRATEVLLAHVALASASRARNDEAAYARHAAALVEMENRPVAEWARDRAAALTARTP